jgi:hypothetical protein
VCSNVCEYAMFTFAWLSCSCLKQQCSSKVDRDLSVVKKVMRVLYGGLLVSDFIFCAMHSLIN